MRWAFFRLLLWIVWTVAHTIYPKDECRGAGSSVMRCSLPFPHLSSFGRASQAAECDELLRVAKSCKPQSTAWSTGSRDILQARLPP